VSVATASPPARRLSATARGALTSVPPSVLLSVVVVIVVVLWALFPGLFTSYSAVQANPAAKFLAPGARHWFGTDDLGRDEFARVVHGAGSSVGTALVAVGIGLFAGGLIGLLAGFLGGWVEIVISRLVDIWMAFPPVLLSILLVAVLGTGLHSVIAAIVVIDWTRFCRVVRTETMGQAQMDYVVAARTIGFSRPAILFREILPNVMPVLIALLTLEMGIAVVVEAILSFVGLSVSSDTPTWGGMIAEGRQLVHEAWWVLAVPLAALFATVVAFNQLGDGLARSLDPVLRR
jgi:dipeptide transport system permease protein